MCILIRQCVVVVTLLLTMGISRVYADQPQWQKMAPLPEGNGGFAAGIIDGRLIVAGGTDWQADVKQWLDGIWEYNPETNQWRRLGTLSQPLAYGGFGVIDNTLYIMGGMNGQGVVGPVFSLSPPDHVETLGRLPAASIYAGSTQLGADLYLIGGSSSVELKGQSPTFYRIGGRTGHTEQLSDYPGGPLILPAVAAAAGRIYVFGGAREDEQTRAVVNLNQAFVYDISQKRWQAIRQFPAARRGLSACTLDNHWILIGGGYGQTAQEPSEGMSNELYLYSIDQDQYIAVAPLPYAAAGALLVRDGATLYVIGGEDQPRHRSNAVYRSFWSQLIPGD